MTPTTPILFLFILALPIACVSWTVTHEELFRETHDYCVRKSKECTSFIGRKFFYLLTCEYCFSHYVALAFMLLTRYQLLYPGWRGYVIGEFALVWVSNQYISIYNRLRLTIRNERVEIETKEQIREQTKSRAADGRSIAGLQTGFNTDFDSLKEITMSKPKAETNAISMLKKDHETVKGLFDKFEGSENAAEKQKIISEAVQELKIHATIEEEIFYPAVRGEMEEQDVMNEAEVEHHVARMLIAELDESNDDEEYQNARFKVLSEAVRHHIKEEEGQMFPQIKDLDMDLDTLGEQMMQRKEELQAEGVPEDSEHGMVAANSGKMRERTTMAAGERKTTTRKQPSRKK
jgi:hemerythrin superfamily protein